MQFNLLSFVACVIALVTWVDPAHATLGNSLSHSPPTATSSTQAITAHKNASLRAPTGVGWSGQQTTLETGTLVQEFSTSDGIVFAVSWQGPVLPDLKALLGQYFSTYARIALQAREARQFGGTMQINEPDLVMQSSGRMRNFFGFAYVPTLVPSGFSIDTLLP